MPWTSWNSNRNMGFFSELAGEGAHICKGCAGGTKWACTGEANPCRCVNRSLFCKNPILLLAVPYSAEGKKGESGCQLMGKNVYLCSWKAFNIMRIVGVFFALGRRRGKIDYNTACIMLLACKLQRYTMRWIANIQYRQCMPVFLRASEQNEKYY